MDKAEFTVIIVGGSIAGLVLAHCLERAKINHIVLEKASDIAPQVGASIGILPNGARVLDQLDIYDEIQQHIEPLETATVCYPDGFSFSSLYPKLIHERFGFPIAFLDRQKLLEILYRRYPHPERIHLNAKVTSIKSTDDGVIVATADGVTYRGHLLVGADGVHSRVRSAMWQNVGKGIANKEKRSMTVEYSCIFGISSSIKGLTVGGQVNALFDHFTIVTIHGKNGRIFWFLIQKLDRKYTYPRGPRFTSEDAAVVATKLRDVRFYKDLTFGHIWDRREVASMTALEENVFQTWHQGRIILVGDSVHKMTPNLGQGANMAIEDAALLSTLLRQLQHGQDGSLPSAMQIENLLRQYRRIRHDRVRSIYSMSKFLVRLQARDGFFNTLFGRYYVPYAGDLPADMASKIIANGEVCGFLPLRSSKDGWDQHRSKRWSVSQWIRSVFALLTFIWLVIRVL